MERLVASMTERAGMGERSGSTALTVWLGRWAMFGFALYLASYYVLDSSAQKTVFYLSVGVPGVLLLSRLPMLLGSHRRALSCLLALLGYLSISSVWGDRGELVSALKYSLYLICLVVAIDAAFRSGMRPAHVVTGLIIVGALSAIAYWASVLLQVDRLGELAGGRYSLYRLAGWGENNPISSAVVFGLTVLAAWWIFPDVGRLKKAALLGVILLCVGLMFLSKSRGPMVALVLTLGLISLWRRRTEDLLLWVGLAAIGAGAVVWLDLGSIIADRASAPNYRMEIWASSLELISAHPFFGQGFGESANITIRPGVAVTHSHSTMLEFFRVGGLIGGVLCAAFLWASFSPLRAGKQASWFFLFWFVYGLGCLSTNGRLPLSHPSIEWFSFWLPLFLSLLGSAEQRYSMFSSTNPAEIMPTRHSNG